MKYLFFLSIIFLGCPDNGVQPPYRPSFSLNAEEVVSTEALIKIEYALSDSITVSLKRNGQDIAQNIRMSKEFVFSDTLLQPKQNYTFVAVKIENGKAVDSTTPLHITTMDTTGHNFVWETYFFGDPSTSSSSLNDIAIVNDTLIYVVGEIYKRDSSGQGEIVYNAAKWNGETWTLLQILVRDFGTGTGYYPLYTVYAFGQNDVWFASNADLIQWNEIIFNPKAFFALSLPFNGQVRKMWGTNSSNMYCVGLNGAIYHYADTDWQKLESGTSNHIYDVWGIINSSTGKEEVYCASSDDFNIENSKLIKITNTTQIDTVVWGVRRSLYTVWTANGKILNAAGGGLWKNTIGAWKQIGIGSNSAMLRIRGNTSNDIFLVGSFGLAAHYNGKDWYYYPELNSASYYSSVSIKDNLVAMVGNVNGRPVVTIGKRP